MKKGNQYKKGANKERWLVNYLKAHGAIVAARSAGSHSPFDVWADFPKFTLRAQCKSGVKPPQEEEAKLLDLSIKIPYAVIMLFWWADRKPCLVTTWMKGEKMGQANLKGETK